MKELIKKAAIVGGSAVVGIAVMAGLITFGVKFFYQLNGG